LRGFYAFRLIDHTSVEMLAINAAKAVRLCGSMRIMRNSFAIADDPFGYM
jgi:hypothetical protein